MKLYVYDSCPFCTRVRTFIGLKNIICDIEFLQAGQFPPHIASRVSKKIVPILEVNSEGSNSAVLMQESLDIIAFLDESFGAHLIRDYVVSNGINRLLGSIAKASSKLCYPRMPQLALPELQSEHAKAFFIQSREERMGCSFSEALLHSDEVASEVLAGLITLNSQLLLNALLINKRGITLDDIATFAELRNLSMVHELQLPEPMKLFADYIAKQSGIPLFHPICKLGHSKEVIND